MTPRDLCFRLEDDRKQLVDMGLSLEAIDETFLRSSQPPPEVDLVAGTPPHVRGFAQREYAGSGFAYDAIRHGAVRTKDPWTNTDLRSRIGLPLSDGEGLPYDMLPTCYRFDGSAGRDFWLVTYSPTGRVTHIILPDPGVVIHDFDSVSGPALLQHLRGLTVRARWRPTKRSPRPVALVPLLANHGHQLINQLSGVERLLNECGADAVEEIWLSGVEFYGRLEDLFPEFRGRVRRFDSPWRMGAAVRLDADLPITIGSTHLTTPTRHRLRRHHERVRAEPGSWSRARPLIAVTVRTEGRVCRNLPEVLAAVIPQLQRQHPGIGVVLDGWVTPDRGRARSASQRRDAAHAADQIDRELALGRRIAELLPGDVAVSSVIGWSMSRSLVALSGIHGYLSHVGALQHKLSFITMTRGVVHGPVSSLRDPDSGHFMSDAGFAPSFLEPDSVVDISAEAGRGPSYRDYDITDTADVLARLEVALSAAPDAGDRR